MSCLLTIPSPVSYIVYITSSYAPTLPFWHYWVYGTGRKNHLLANMLLTELLHDDKLQNGLWLMTKLPTVFDIWQRLSDTLLSDVTSEYAQSQALLNKFLPRFNAQNPQDIYRWSLSVVVWPHVVNYQVMWLHIKCERVVHHHWNEHRLKQVSVPILPFLSARLVSVRTGFRDRIPWTRAGSGHIIYFLGPGLPGLKF